MRTSLKYSVLFAGIWFLGKYLLFYMQWLQSPTDYPKQVLWNIFCLLLAMGIGSLVEKRKEDRTQSTVLGDIKGLIGIGMVYSIIVSGLIYLYYAKIDPAYNEKQIAVIEEAMEKTVNDPVQFKKLKAERPELQALTADEILQKSRETTRPWYNPQSVMTIALLGMMMLTVINSIGFTVIYRKVLFRQPRN